MRRLMRLVIEPSQAWSEIAKAPLSIDQLVRRALPLSVLPAAASVVGMRVFDASWSPQHGYHVGADAIVRAGVATLVGSMASVFALAAIFFLLAPMYDARRDFRAALNVAVLGTVPLWASGMLLLLPAMVIACMAALCHSFYLYYVGAGEVLGVKRADQAEFVAASLFLLAVASTLVGAAASAIGLV